MLCALGVGVARGDLPFTSHLITETAMAIGVTSNQNRPYVAKTSAEFGSGPAHQKSRPSAGNDPNQINQRFMRHLQSAPRYHVLTVMVE